MGRRCPRYERGRRFGRRRPGYRRRRIDGRRLAARRLRRRLLPDPQRRPWRIWSAAPAIADSRVSAKSDAGAGGIVTYQDMRGNSFLGRRPRRGRFLVFAFVAFVVGRRRRGRWFVFRFVAWSRVRGFAHLGSLPDLRLPIIGHPSNRLGGCRPKRHWPGYTALVRHQRPAARRRLLLCPLGRSAGRRRRENSRDLAPVVFRPGHDRSGFRS
jgi:hypothetical protein